jgi:hypothetical protein
MPGTNCANVPTSLALRSGATLLLPVALPPGCARLAASPDPTGSEMPRKTIGIVEVARRTARAVGVAQATMTSTLLCKTSEMRPGSCANEPFGQRTSMDRFFPSVQPRCWSASRKALSIAGSGDTAPITATRQTLPVCCARAASGQAAAAPPSSVMKSRRFIIRSPRRRGRAGSVALQGRALSRS